MKAGELLEKVVAHFCSGIKDSKVTRDAKIMGRDSRVLRQIDVLIEGKVGFCNFKIQVEAKDYSKPVNVKQVESFIAMVKDTGVDLGVMVCPKGFSSAAKNVALNNNIQLFEIISEDLGNQKLFIPVRMVLAEIDNFAIDISATVDHPFSIPADLSLLLVQKDGQYYNLKQRLIIAWNEKQIPQEAGDYDIELGAVKAVVVGGPKNVKYFELGYHVVVKERYFLKIYPANFMKNSHDDKKHYDVRVDFYSKEEDLSKNWKEFESFEELNKAADIENQTEDIRDFIVQPFYEIDIENVSL